MANHSTNQVLNRSTLNQFSVPPRTMQIWFYANLVLFSVSVVLFSHLLAVLWAQLRCNTKTASGSLVFHQIVIEALMATGHHLATVIRTYQSQQRFATRSEWCYHYFFCYIIMVSAGLWGVFFLALNRYIAILSPLSYKKWTRKRVIVAKIACCWVIGFFSSFSFYLGYDGGFASSPPYGFCIFGNNKMPFILSSVFNTYLPLGASGILYGAVVAKSMHQKVFGTKVDGRTGNSSRLQLANTLFLCWLLYCICFAATPIMMTAAPKAFLEPVTSRLWFRSLFFCGYLGTPIAFFGMNRSYRAEVARMYRPILGGRIAPHPANIQRFFSVPHPTSASIQPTEGIQVRN